MQISWVGRSTTFSLANYFFTSDFPLFLCYTCFFCATFTFTCLKLKIWNLSSSLPQAASFLTPLRGIIFWSELFNFSLSPSLCQHQHFLVNQQPTKECISRDHQTSPFFVRFPQSDFSPLSPSTSNSPSSLCTDDSLVSIFQFLWPAKISNSLPTRVQALCILFGPLLPSLDPLVPLLEPFHILHKDAITQQNTGLILDLVFSK